MKKLEEQTLVLSETMDENNYLKRQVDGMQPMLDSLRQENTE